MTSVINCGGEPYILLSTMNEIMGLLWQRVDSVTEPTDLSTGYATALGDIDMLMAQVILACDAETK